MNIRYCQIDLSKKNVKLEMGYV